MSFPTYPNTPPPADYERTPLWSVERVQYESGFRQGYSLWHRPLYQYSLSYTNATDPRRKLIEDFVNTQRGGATPFLFTDPKTEHHFVSSAAIGYFVSSKQGRFYTAPQSWRVIPVSGAFSVISVLSGTLTQGVHYAYSQDNGLVTVFTASVNSSDSYRWSGTYARLCRLDTRAIDFSSRVWGSYRFDVAFDEELPT